MPSLLDDFRTRWRSDRLKEVGVFLLLTTAAVVVAIWLNSRSRTIAASQRDALLFIICLGVAAIGAVASVVAVVELAKGPAGPGRTVDSTITGFLTAVLWHSGKVVRTYSSAVAYLTPAAAAEFADWPAFEAFWKNQDSEIRNWLQRRCSDAPMTDVRYTIDLGALDDLGDTTTVRARVTFHVKSQGALLERSFGPVPIVVELPIEKHDGFWYLTSGRLRWEPAEGAA